ncbi:zf-HC2 domain-containing protein, partial [bacterium]|nr:zf-HC2 domain-containing protein [bacterium]
MNCISYQEQIALWIEGDLPADQSALLEAHSRTCETCRSFTAEMKESQAQLRKLKDGTDNAFVYQKIRSNVLAQISPVPPKRSIPWFWRVIVIATVMAGVALGSAWFYTRLPIHGPEQSLTENKKKSPAPKKAPIHTKIPAPRKIEKERV